MEEDFSEKKKKHLEEDLILRKSLLRGHTTKIAHDNIKLRENLRNMVRNFLRGGNEGKKPSDDSK